ncbi:hypothetical protein Gorai_024325, partial [Gossypium raimondii]|nr:hypothetical protein [Gossypium raimondii]
MVAMEDNIADSLNFKVSLFDSKLDEEEDDLEKDDFELIDGDVTTQMVDNVPDIQFSDKATYKNNIIQATGGMIGQVIKVNKNTNNGEDTNAQSVVDPRVTQQPTSTSLNIRVGMKDMVQSLMHVLGTGVPNNSIKAMEQHFHLIVSEYQRDFGFEITTLVETRMAGSKADLVVTA